MEIHKPKPIHNWREFLKEYAIVVLGVVTALAAEQAVEWLHWKHRVADARAAMVLEMRDDNAPEAYVRVAAYPCFARQLDTLQDAVEAGQSRAQIAKLVADYRLPNRTWRTTSWDALIASDVASHIPPEQLIQWSVQHDLVPNLVAVGARETQDWGALRLTRRSGERLSETETDTVLATISRLRLENRAMRDAGMGLLSNLRGGGIEMAPQERSNILAGLKKLYSDCVVSPSPFLGAPSYRDQLWRLRPVMPTGIK